jgi:hypothetical protein
MSAQQKKTTATIVTPQEYSGSNTLDSYNQGVYVNSVNAMFGSTVVKLRPNNDFLKVRMGKKSVALDGPFDDMESPSSVIVSGTSGTGNLVFYPSLIQLDQNKSSTAGSQITGYNVAPSHFILRNEYGQPVNHQDGSPFLETAVFPSGSIDPVYIIQTENFDAVYPEDLVNSTELTSTDGVIDQFDVRGEIARSYTEIPYRFKGIKIDFVNTDLFLRSILISEEIPEISIRLNPDMTLRGIEPFLDAGDEFGLDDLVGLPPESCGPISGFGYINEPNSSIEPFLDTNDSDLTSLLLSGSEIVSGVLSMSPDYPTHTNLSLNHVSLARGFDYIGSERGFDSVAFGGLTRV